MAQVQQYVVSLPSFLSSPLAALSASCSSRAAPAQALSDPYHHIAVDILTSCYGYRYLDASTRDQYASGDLDARVEDVLGQIRELSIAGTV